MRVIRIVAILLALGDIAAADGLLKREPTSMAPGTTVYVDNGHCSPGKILRVTAAFKGTARRKTCIHVDSKEAALSGTERPIHR